MSGRELLVAELIHEAEDASFEVARQITAQAESENELLRYQAKELQRLREADPDGIFVTTEALERARRTAIALAYHVDVITAESSMVAAECAAHPIQELCSETAAINGVDALYVGSHGLSEVIATDLSLGYYGRQTHQDLPKAA